VTTTILIWLLVIALVLVGLAGTLIPALPGITLIYAGLFLGAWADDFQKVGVFTLTLLAVLTLGALVLDYVAGLFGAKKAGATRLAVFGAAVGTVVGLFFGPLGMLAGPFAGAFTGELLANRSVLKAGKVGFGTWLGIIVGTCLKLALSFSMIGIFVLKYLLS
jgi:uncharacterized protein YqgC (DUF456 family)